MAGGGGIAAANFLYSGAEKDGSQIGLLQNNTPFEPLLRAPGRAITDEIQLARHAERRDQLVRGAGTRCRSMRSTTRNSARSPSARPALNSTPAFYARLLNDVLRHSSSRSQPAIPARPRPYGHGARRDRRLHRASYSALLVTQGGLATAEEDQAAPLLRAGRSVPSSRACRTRATSSGTRTTATLLDAAFAPLALGRPLAMPPGVPADRLAAMRKALADDLRRSGIPEPKASG